MSLLFFLNLFSLFGCVLDSVKEGGQFCWISQKMFSAGKSSTRLLTCPAPRPWRAPAACSSICTWRRRSRRARRWRPPAAGSRSRGSSGPGRRCSPSRTRCPALQDQTVIIITDRKIETKILGQPNPETKSKQNIFGGHFDTYTKLFRKRPNGFLNRSPNVL